MDYGNLDLYELILQRPTADVEIRLADKTVLTDIDWTEGHLHIRFRQTLTVSSGETLRVDSGSHRPVVEAVEHEKEARH